MGERDSKKERGERGKDRVETVQVVIGMQEVRTEVTNAVVPAKFASCFVLLLIPGVLSPPPNPSCARQTLLDSVHSQ